MEGNCHRVCAHQYIRFLTNKSSITALHNTICVKYNVSLFDRTFCEKESFLKQVVVTFISAGALLPVIYNICFLVEIFETTYFYS